MSSIDTRIVELKLKAEQFQQGLSKAGAALTTFKEKLHLDGVTSGLQSLSEKVRSFDMSAMAAAPDGVADRFNVLSIAAGTALGNIATKAISAGASVLKSFTLDPVLDGLSEWETQMGAIQTILANTQSKGTTMADVTASLDELNLYADKTIYNFSEMTRNIGLFTAAGVGLKESTAAIKGISNLAAMMGANSMQATSAMTQLSQALASGSVKLQDWNSVVYAGMGGEEFQEALKRTARVHGEAVDHWIEKEGTFRESLKDGWLTSSVLLETLSQIAGDYNDEQLEAMGYTADQIAEIQRMAQTATSAATEVKTFNQLLDTTKEAVGSGWAKTFQIVFGNFEEAKALFTGISLFLTGVVDKASDARNNLLQGWKDLGGRTELIEGLKNAFMAIWKPLTAIGNGFKAIFTGPTAQGLYNITHGFANLTSRLVMGEETLGRLQRVAAGFFSVVKLALFPIVGTLKIVATIVSKVASGFLSLGQTGAGGLLGLAAVIGDVTKKVVSFVTSFDVFGITARAIGRVIDAVIGSIKHMWAWFTNLGTVIKAAIPESLVEKWKKLTDAVKKFFGLGDGQNKALTKLGEVTSKVSAKFDAFQEKIKGKVQPVLDKVTAKVSNLATRGFTKLDGVMDKVLAKFQAFKAKFQEKWGDVTAASADKLKTKLGELREKASMTWADKGAPKLAELRQRMHELAEEGKATWAEQAVPRIQRFKTALSTAFHNLLNGGGIKEALSELKAAFKDLFSIDLSGIKSKLGGVIEPFKIKDTDLGGKIIPKVKEGFAQVKAYVEAKDWKGLGRYIVESFSKGLKATAHGFGDFFEPMVEKLKAQAEKVQTAAGEIGESKIKPGIESLSTSASNAMESFKAKMQALNGKFDIGTMLKAALGIGAGVGIFKAWKGLFNGPLAETLATLNETLENFAETFKSFSNKMNAEAEKLKAERMLILAGAIGVLALSLYVLAKVPAENLTSAGIAIGVLAATMVKSIKALEGLKGGLGRAMIMATSLILLGFAFATMAGALKDMGEMDDKQLSQGLIGMAAVTTAMIVLVKKMSDGGLDSGKKAMILQQAKSMMVIAIAMQLVAGAIFLLGSMDIATLFQGTVAIAAILAVFAVYENYGGELNPSKAVAMLILAGSLIAVAGLVAILGSMPWGKFISGIIKLGIIIGLMVASTKMVSAGDVTKSVLLIALTLSVKIAASAIRQLASMGWGELFKGMTMMWLVIKMLVKAVNEVKAGDADNAGVLIVLAASLYIFAKALQALGGLSMTAVAIGMIALGLALKILLGAASQAEKVSAGMFSLAGALLAIGLAVALAGAGMLMAAIGLGSLVGMGGAAIGMIASIGETILNLIPLLFTVLAQGLVNFAQIMVDNAPVWTNLMIMLIMCLVDAINATAPSVIACLIGVLIALVTAIEQSLPTFIEKGANIIVSLLQGLASNLGRIITAATDVIVAFLDGISANMSRIIDSGMKLIDSFLQGIAQAISKHGPSMLKHGMDIGKAIIKGIVNAIKAGVSEVWNAVTDLASQAWEGFTSWLGIHSPSRVFMKGGQYIIAGLVKGLEDDTYKAEQATETLAKHVNKAFNDSVSLVDAEATPTIRPVVDLSAVRASADELGDIFSNSVSMDPTLALARTVSAPSAVSAAAGTGTVENHYNFQQVNNSPKHLDRYEIRRDTQLLFRQFQELGSR